MRGQVTHPYPDVLAEFRAGLIPGRRGARVAAHLAACDRCAALTDQLAEVSVLLAAVPAPAMPDSVAQRLDTVLAAEMAGTDFPERAGGDGSPDCVTDIRPARHRGVRLVTVRVLAPAAAAVALAAAGYALSHISGPTSSTAAGSTAAVPAPTRAISKPRNGGLGGPALIPAIRSSSFNVVSSRTDYQRTTLRQQLERERLASAEAGPAQPASAQLKQCVQRVTSGVSPGTPVLVESAHFQGQPATVIVASSGHDEMAWVVAPGCSATDSHVLDTTTLPGTSAP
jgi:hypothetical protein